MKQKKFYLKNEKTPQKGDLKNEFIDYTCPMKLFNNFDKICSEEIKSKSLIVRTILRNFEDLLSDKKKTINYLSHIILLDALIIDYILFLLEI